MKRKSSKIGFLSALILIAAAPGGAQEPQDRFGRAATIFSAHADAPIDIRSPAWKVVAVEDPNPLHQKLGLSVVKVLSESGSRDADRRVGWCTGLVVSPGEDFPFRETRRLAIVTAAHCISGGGIRVERFDSTFPFDVEWIGFAEGRDLAFLVLREEPKGKFFLDYDSSWTANLTPGTFIAAGFGNKEGSGCSPTGVAALRLRTDLKPESVYPGGFSLKGERTATCGGDSGGPALRVGRWRRLELLGILSRGVGRSSNYTLYRPPAGTDHWIAPGDEAGRIGATWRD